MNENNFFSLDRLIEFGLGMAVARQMIDVMNQSMQSMYVPGSVQSIAAPAVMPIYIIIDGKSVGPLSANEFANLVSEKKIAKNSLAWTPGLLNWQPIEQIPALLKIIALTPPPVPTL